MAPRMRPTPAIPAIQVIRWAKLGLTPLPELTLMGLGTHVTVIRTKHGQRATALRVPERGSLRPYRRLASSV